MNLDRSQNGPHEHRQHNPSLLVQPRAHFKCRMASHRKSKAAHRPTSLSANSNDIHQIHVQVGMSIESSNPGLRGSRQPNNTPKHQRRDHLQISEFNLSKRDLKRGSYQGTRSILDQTSGDVLRQLRPTEAPRQSPNRDNPFEASQILKSERLLHVEVAGVSATSIPKIFEIRDTNETQFSKSEHEWGWLKHNLLQNLSTDFLSKTQKNQLIGLVPKEVIDRFVGAKPNRSDLNSTFCEDNTPRIHSETAFVFPDPEPVTLPNRRKRSLNLLESEQNSTRQKLTSQDVRPKPPVPNSQEALTAKDYQISMIVEESVSLEGQAEAKQTDLTSRFQAPRLRRMQSHQNPKASDFEANFAANLKMSKSFPNFQNDYHKRSYRTNRSNNINYSDNNRTINHNNNNNNICHNRGVTPPPSQTQELPINLTSAGNLPILRNPSLGSVKNNSNDINFKKLCSIEEEVKLQSAKHVSEIFGERNRLQIGNEIVDLKPKSENFAAPAEKRLYYKHFENNIFVNPKTGIAFLRLTGNGQVKTAFSVMQLQFISNFLKYKHWKGPQAELADKHHFSHPGSSPNLENLDLARLTANPRMRHSLHLGPQNLHEINNSRFNLPRNQENISGNRLIRPRVRSLIPPPVAKHRSSPKQTNLQNISEVSSVYAPSPLKPDHPPPPLSAQLPEIIISPKPQPLPSPNKQVTHRRKPQTRRRRKQKKTSKTRRKISKPLTTQAPQPRKKRKPRKSLKGCQCSRSFCLRLHCVCFKNNQFCNKNCKCLECQNQKSNSEFIEKVRKSTQDINPHAFEERVLSVKINGTSKKLTKGCHCSKNKCLKNYCECRKLSLSCSSLCHCDDCQNDKIQLEPKLAAALSKRKSRKKRKILITRGAKNEMMVTQACINKAQRN